MVAIFKDSGTQFKVNPGDVVLVDKKDMAEGSDIEFDKVLLVDDKIGTPYVEGAKVKGVVKGVVLGDKIYVQKFKRRKNYRRRTGHRQQYTEVEIKSIDA